MEGTVSLKDIINSLKKRWLLIVLITLIASLISGAVSYYLLTPIYQASTQLLVNQKTAENQIDYSRLQSNIDLINTYSGIIKSPVILEKVIDRLGLNESVDQLNHSITISSQENSQIFSLIVENPDPERAVEITNTISATFQEDIKQIMNVDNVSILAKAELKKNPVPVRPKPLINIVIATVIGFMAGVGLALLLDFMDNTLKDDQDAAAYLGLPVLGSIQKMPRAERKGRKDVEVQNIRGETIVSQSGK